MSYEASRRKVGGEVDTGYHGVSAEEMGRMQPMESHGSEDQQGLLSHAQSVPQSSAPWQPQMPSR